MLTIIPNNAIPAATHDIDMFGPRIGVKAAVDISPYASFVPRASKQEFAAVVVSWGSPAGEPSPACAPSSPLTTAKPAWAGRAFPLHQSRF